jgi:hypothetical protein
MSEPIKRYRFDEAVSLEDFDGPWMHVADHERIVNELRAAMPSDEWLKAADFAIEKLVEAAYFDAISSLDEVAQLPSWRSRLHDHLRRRIKEQE